jgi:hypothetical protein
MNKSLQPSALIRTLTVCLVILSFTARLNAQDYKKFAFGPGFGIGIGGFNPVGVNEYIDRDLTNYITINTDLYMYETANFFLNFKFKWFDVTPLVEYAIGPKIVVGGNGNYFFNRLSPGVLADFFIPMGRSGKNAFFIGGGAQLHMMSFEGYEGQTIGYRAQMGFDIQFGKSNVQPYLAFNLAKATDVIFSNTSNRDLDYTGGQIGVNFSFHKIVGHRGF